MAFFSSNRDGFGDSDSQTGQLWISSYITYSLPIKNDGKNDILSMVHRI